jgi:hypothetical protein
MLAAGFRGQPNELFGIWAVKHSSDANKYEIDFHTEIDWYIQLLVKHSIHRRTAESYPNFY